MVRRAVNIRLSEICLSPGVSATPAFPIVTAVSASAAAPGDIERVSLATGFRIVDPDNRRPAIAGRTHELLIATPVDSLKSEAVRTLGHRLITLKPAKRGGTPADRANECVRSADLDLRGIVDDNLDRALALAGAAPDFRGPPVRHPLPPQACDCRGSENHQTTAHSVPAFMLPCFGAWRRSPGINSRDF